MDLVATVGDRRDSAYADNDGRFEFTDLSAGRYTLSAWKSGHALATFGARTPWEPGAIVAVEPGQSMERVEITLAKGAAISGRVVDESGEPLTDMQVTAGAAAAFNGRLEFRAPTRTTTTDDHGEYRIGGLPPGTCFVSVSGRMPAALAGGDGAPRMRTTFYPQAALLSQARGIPLRAGDEIGSIDLVLIADASPAPTISGRVIDPSGTAVQAGVVATSSGDAVSPIIRSLTTMLQQSGEFSMRLTPGEYTLTAQTEDMIATTRLTVDRSDIGGIELQLVKGARVSGRVAFEGTAPRPPSGFEVMPFVASGPVDGPAPPRINYRPGRVRADGSFSVSNLIGPVEFRIVPVNRGWRPKALIIGGRNVLDVPVEFKGGEDVRNVVIQMSDRTASLVGTVSGLSEAMPAAGVSVLVFPYDSRQISHRAQWVRPDQYGRFVVADLSPGDYLVAPTTDVDDLQWRTAAYLDRLRATATRVVLGDGETKSLALEWPGTR